MPKTKSYDVNDRDADHSSEILRVLGKSKLAAYRAKLSQLVDDDVPQRVQDHMISCVIDVLHDEIENMIDLVRLVRERAREKDKMFSEKYVVGFVVERHEIAATETKRLRRSDRT